MKPLTELIKRGGELFYASDFNALADEARRQVSAGQARDRSEAEIASWQVSPRAVDAGWEISVAPGFINDQVPTIPYLRVGDPRGWVKPDDYREPAQGDEDYSETFIDRDLLDDDPPVLLADADADFAVLSDDQRPAYFRTEEMWEMEIRRAHVILTAQPIRAPFYPPDIAPLPFRRYRCALVRQLPSRSFAVRAGGWIELATLYLVRDPQTGKESDRVLVAQKEFHDFGVLVVEPRVTVGGGGSEAPSFGGIGLGLADSVAMGAAAVADAFADQLQAAVDNILAPTATVEFWTV